jgi:hypothetical protein
LTAFWAVIYATSLSSQVLFDDTDTLNAVTACEMVQRGDWVTLKINNS